MERREGRDADVGHLVGHMPGEPTPGSWGAARQGGAVPEGRGAAQRAGAAAPPYGYAEEEGIPIHEGTSRSDAPQDEDDCPPRITIPHHPKIPSALSRAQRESLVFPGIKLPEVNHTNLEHATDMALGFWAKKSRIVMDTEMLESCRAFMRNAIIAGRVLREALLEASSSRGIDLKAAEASTSSAYDEIGRAVLRSAYNDERDAQTKRKVTTALKEIESNHILTKTEQVLREWEAAQARIAATKERLGSGIRSRPSGVAVRPEGTASTASKNGVTK